MTSALHVLVDGVVLSQPMGGVRRHNEQLLPRAARLLEETGGSLSVLEGRDGLPFELPASVRRITSGVPAGPPLRRALPERRAIEQAVSRAEQPYGLLHTAHFPVPRLPLPFTVTVHDLRALELEHTPMSRRLLARSVIGGALRRAAGVLTVSKRVTEQLRESFQLGPEVLHIVPNAADHLPLLPRDVGPGAPLLHVGHLEPRKNLGLLLEALALKPNLPRLVLAGAAKGHELERLRERARELGVEGRVEFPGPVPEEELPRLYSTAAALALPSLLEGFGIPLAEALRAGVPVACSQAGALPGVLEQLGARPGVDAELFDPGDASACATALERAVSRSGTRQPGSSPGAGTTRPRGSWPPGALPQSGLSSRPRTPRGSRRDLRAVQGSAGTPRKGAPRPGRAARS